MTAANFMRVTWIVAIVASVVVLARWNAGSEWLRPQAILPAATLLIGFASLSWQLDRQHHNVIDTNRRQARDRLRSEIYNELAKRFITVYGSLTPSLDFINEAHRRIVSKDVTHSDISRLQAAVQRCSECVEEFGFLFEAYEIALHDFVSERGRLYQLSERLQKDLKSLSSAASASLAASATIQSPQLSQQLVAKLSALVTDIEIDVLNLGTVARDFAVLAQKRLLGELFPEVSLGPAQSGKSGALSAGS